MSAILYSYRKISEKICNLSENCQKVFEIADQISEFLQAK